jgi:outer membrane receptor protein involved in Fe transport
MKNYPVRSYGALPRLAAFGLSLSLLSGTAAYAQSTDDANKDDVKLEKFEVTGSRIKRLDVETPSPVVRITAEALANTGFSNVDDALRALPFNNGTSIVPTSSGTGFASGTSTVNFRGLGNNNTLVLINGRRAVPSGAGAFNGFQSVIDLRQIPAEAIETIEVLKDGASAIYGSDAVAGVLNIRLKRNYTGVGTTISFGNTFNNDSLEKKGFIIAGASTAKTNIVALADYSHRNSIKDADFPWSNNADLRFNRTATGQLETNPAGTELIGVDLRSSNTFPARFFIPGTNTIRTFLNPTQDPNPTNAVAVSRVTGAGLYNFQQDTYLLPEQNSFGFQVYARHQFLDNLYGFSDLIYKRVEALNASAPSPFSTTDRGAGTNGRLVVPASNPYNPYGTRYFGAAGRSIELSTYRLVNAGPRFRDTTSEYPRLVFGLGGDLPKEWSWELAGMYASGSFLDTAPGTAFDSTVQQALNGVNIAGQILYANPFGPEDPRVTDFYSGNNPNYQKFTSNLYDITFTGDLFDLPAGPVGLAVGGEFRKESLIDVRTLENETGNVVGGSEGFGTAGKRNVSSVYAEVKVPVFKQLELQLAARNEQYSDFGNTTKPKVALAWRPAKWLILRGSFSESFKAPDLEYLYSAFSVSFTGSQLFDPRRPDQPSTQIRTVGRGNPSLQPEETKTYSYGFVLDVPSGPLKGLMVDVSYFKFDQSNLIARDGATFTLANELNLPAGRVVRNTLTPEEIAAGFTVGTLNFIATDWYNANKLLYEGYDISLAYTLKTERFGRFNFGADATYLKNLDLSTINSLGTLAVIDLDGTDARPLWRANGTVAWRKGDWAASIFLVYQSGWPPGGLTTLPEPLVGDQLHVNPQISYRGLWKTNITVGVRNVFDRPPPRYLDGSTGYQSSASLVDPSFWYIRLNREF